MTVAVAVSLIAGFAVGAWVTSAAPTAGEESAATPASRDAGSADTLAERLLSVEQLIAEEREARLELAGQVQDLIDDLESDAVAEAPRAAESSAENGRRDEPRGGGLRRAQDFTAMIRRFEDRRLQSLMDNGFSEDEARRVLQRESEAEFKSMQLAWEAQREGTPLDQLAALNDPQALLRAELGDADYERFLVAQGQPTSVQITRVLNGSPGSEAGLQPGDQIVSYDGERVFNVADMRELTLQGAAGEDVVIEIDREGVRMQLSVPRGPVGITGSGANIRRMNRWGGG
jgi:hypothetical protein